MDPTQSSSFDLHAHLAARLPAWRARWRDAATIDLEPALVGAHVAVAVGAFDTVLDALLATAVSARPGGRVLVRTEHIEAVGGEIGPEPPLAPGRYLRCVVHDEGEGYDGPVRRALLDAGPGAGAGAADAADAGSYAQALAFARAAGGAFWLDTAPGHGTRASLYLPEVRPEGSPPREIVLLVEDERAVRTIVRRILLGQGFIVREARDGDAALRFWHAERAHVRGVVTDVVMPGLGGRDLARELRRLEPAMPILFISAYAGDVPDLLDGVDPPRRLLVKPFTTEALLTTLRDVLAR